MLPQSFPDKYIETVDGKEVSIPFHTDFRQWMRFEELITDSRVNRDVLSITALRMIFPERLPSDLMRGALFMLWFYRCGEKLPKKALRTALSLWTAASHTALTVISGILPLHSLKNITLTCGTYLICTGGSSDSFFSASTTANFRIYVPTEMQTFPKICPNIGGIFWKRCRSCTSCLCRQMS